MRIDCRPAAIRGSFPDVNNQGVLTALIAPSDDPMHPKCEITAKDMPLLANLRIAARKTDAGYAIELSLPLDFVHLVAGKKWTDIAVNVSLNDIDAADEKRCQLWWRGDETSWKNNSQWQRFVRPGASKTNAVGKSKFRLPKGALLFWDGEDESREAGFNGKHSAKNDKHAHTGKHCAMMHRGVHRYPEIKSRNRYQMKQGDELWFWVKADRPVKDTFKVVLMGDGVSNFVDIGPYIEGGELTTQYRRVRIPVKAFVNDKFKGKSISILELGRKPWPKVSYVLYLDDVYFVDPDKQQ